MRVIPNKRAYTRPEPTSRSLDFRRNRKKKDYSRLWHFLILAAEILAVAAVAYLIIESFATQVTMTEDSMERLPASCPKYITRSPYLNMYIRK